MCLKLSTDISAQYIHGGQQHSTIAMLAKKEIFLIFFCLTAAKKKTSTSKRSGKIAPVKGSHYTPPKGTEAPLPPSFYHPEWVKEDREQYKKSYGTLEGWEPPDL